MNADDRQKPSGKRRRPSDAQEQGSSSRPQRKAPLDVNAKQKEPPVVLRGAESRSSLRQCPSPQEKPTVRALESNSIYEIGPAQQLAASRKSGKEVQGSVEVPVLLHPHSQQLAEQMPIGQSAFG